MEPINANKLFAGTCDFMAGAASVDAIPADGQPEIAFVGRSNVGKSSLINALTGRKALARTSNTPGRTRQLNFFLLGGIMMLVDLPGYGYAEASKTNIATWTDLTRVYLRGRACLRRVCLLIDGRRGVGKADIEFMTMLDESAVSYQIILTKIDKLSTPQINKQIEEIGLILRKHPAAMDEILVTSSENKAGIDILRDSLVKLLEQ